MIRRSGDWLCAAIGDELLMMSVERGAYLGMTDVGARIWALLEQPHEMADICAALEREFDVAPEVCRSSVEAFVASLVTAKAAVIDSVQDRPRPIRAARVRSGSRRSGSR